MFIPALIFFLNGIYDDFVGWTPARSPLSRSTFVINNAFGIRPCEGDCFSVVGVLALIVSGAYSIGAALALQGRTATRHGLQADTPEALMGGPAPRDKGAA